MSKLPQISEAEFEVMKVIWKYAPISTNEVTEKLTQTTDWSPKTIQTMLKRLVTKKALTYEKQSRVFVYTPLVPETEYIRQESNSFLNKYYNGNHDRHKTLIAEMFICPHAVSPLVSSAQFHGCPFFTCKHFLYLAEISSLAPFRFSEKTFSLCP